MKSVKRILAIALFVVPIVVASTAFTQEPSTSTDQAASATSNKDLNLRAYAELLRADVKSKKVAIITEIMQFNDADAATFWPIYREYDYEMSKLGDKRVDLIQDYITNYDNITNEKATELMTAVFAFEVQRAQLKQKYFDIMSKALSPRTAARFFQVDNQIQHIVDLQISANLPAMQ